MFSVVSRYSNNYPEWKNPLHADLYERKIQVESRQFLEKNLPYISTQVLSRLRALNHVNDEAYFKYKLTMPSLGSPTEEQKKIIKTFHEKLKPYIKEFAEGNTFLRSELLESKANSTLEDSNEPKLPSLQDS